MNIPNIEVEEKSIWKEARTEIPHKVVSVRGNEIITWSEPTKKIPGVGGYSWMGDKPAFLKEFKPA